MQNYDYSQSGYYFVTINTQDHEHYFGEIENGKMILKNFGKATAEYWREIPNHFPNAILDEYIIMPNHIHGIIMIDYENNNNNAGVENIRVGDENFHPLRKNNLSSIIKGFKIGVTKWCRENNYDDFKWQRSFHDRIIRNDNELYNVRNYIKNNPLKWNIEEDMVENIDI